MREQNLHGIFPQKERHALERFEKRRTNEEGGGEEEFINSKNAPSALERHRSQI